MRNKMEKTGWENEYTGWKLEGINLYTQKEVYIYPKRGLIK